MINAERLNRTLYSLHGIPVSVEWDEPAALRQAPALLKCFGLSSAGPIHDGKRRPLRLQFLFADDPCLIPAAAEAVGEHGGLQAWQHERNFYLSDGRSTARMMPAGGQAQIFVHPSLWTAPYVLRKDLIIFTLLILLRHRGGFGLHAAALEKGGCAVLIVADCGSGKSTLSLSLLRAGWNLISDDSVLLRREGETVEALALRRDFCVNPDAGSHFPEIVDHWERCRLSDDDRRRINVESLYGDRLVSACRPTVLICPQITGRRNSRLIPIGRAESLLCLIRQSAVVAIDPPAAAGQIQLLARLVRQTAGYRLWLGTDLLENPGKVLSLLPVRSKIQRTRRGGVPAAQPVGEPPIGKSI